MVVLVDGSGVPIGTQSKESVHGTSTPRHLAFSCHIVDDAGRILVTRRALSKVAWPGVWTNAVCGHPQPGETMEQAVRRRVAFELGSDAGDIVCVLPDFGYSARDASGIQENEYCPVFVARALSPLAPNPDEVAESRWTTPSDLITAVSAAPWAFSPWLVAHIDDVAPHLTGTTADAHV